MQFTRKMIVFLILLFLAAAWSIYKAQNPGGTSIPFFLTFLILTLINYYVGFVDKSRNPLRYLSQAATFIFLLLTILMAHVFRVEDNAVEEISQYINVYPNIEDIHMVPRVSQSELQHWLLKTSDSVSAVKMFYADSKNLRDWKVKIAEPMIVLGNGQLKLTITIGEQPRSELTNIFYRLESTE